MCLTRFSGSSVRYPRQRCFGIIYSGERAWCIYVNNSGESMKLIGRRIIKKNVDIHIRTMGGLLL